MLKRFLVSGLVVGILGPPGLIAQTEDQIVDQARRAVVTHKLVDKPTCVGYMVTRNIHPGVDEVEVREVHDKRCGGDPGVAPLILVLRIDEVHHKIARLDIASDKFVLLQP